MIVFTNGCFDILHIGHVKLLEFCKSLGSKVIVGLNTDKSVKLIKGKQRPINCEQDRKKILESLKFVDEVILFDEETPYNLINEIQPDIIVKGGDYSKEQVVGYHLETQGLGKIVLFNYIDGKSTTNIIGKIKNDICI